MKVSNYTGRSTFTYILAQVKDCIDDIQVFFHDKDVDEVYNTDNLVFMKEIFNKRTDISPLDLALYDIAYLIVYYGTSYLDANSLLRLLRRYYNTEFVRQIIVYISLKPHKDSGGYNYWLFFKGGEINLVNAIDNIMPLSDTGQNLLKNLQDSGYFKFYGGHQYKLSHYYRHLFQSVKYINEQSILCYDEKYEYVKTLRAQISSPEQYLLFFNSISSLGRAWELNEDGRTEPRFDNYLITKYNLIKNIPDFILFNAINIRSFYPLVEYELSDRPINRKEIELNFN
jgi:hypothetical protein